MFLLGKLASKLKAEPLLAGLLVFSGVSAILIVVLNHYAWVWLTYGLAVIPTVMLLSTCTAWLSSQVRNEDQGQALGNNQALLVLGECLSAAIGGFISAIMIALPVVIMGLILLVSFWIFRQRYKSSALVE